MIKNQNLKQYRELIYFEKPNLIHQTINVFHYAFEMALSEVKKYSIHMLEN